MTPDSPRVAAFFDFDRTLVDTDAGVLFGKELLAYYRRKAYADRPGTVGWLGRVLRFHARMLRLGVLTLGARLLYRVGLVKRSRLVGIGYGLLRGVPIDEIRFLARDFVDEILVQRAYPDALQLLRDHQRQGHRVVIATTNMRLLVENVKRHWPVDDVIGVELLTHDGVATGAFSGPTYGAEKAEAIRAYAHGRSLSLPRSYAYTDHYSDHFILPLVGHPYVVNPGWRLRWLARRHRWKVVWFRTPPRARPTRT